LVVATCLFLHLIQVGVVVLTNLLIDSMRAILSVPFEPVNGSGAWVHVSEYALHGLAQFAIAEVVWDVEIADVFTRAFWPVSLLVAFACGQSGAVIVKDNAESHRRALFPDTPAVS
jgi:hypothetical protein